MVEEARLELEGQAATTENVVRAAKKEMGREHAEYARLVGPQLNESDKLGTRDAFLRRVHRIAAQVRTNKFC